MNYWMLCVFTSKSKDKRERENRRREEKEKELRKLEEMRKKNEKK